MFIQFLVEDQSGGKLIEAVMEKYKAENDTSSIEYKIKPYKGIGGLQKGADAKNVKAEQLLTELPKRLRAYNAELKWRDDAALFIVLDNDDRETEKFRKELKAVAEKNKITMDHVFCIAVEEMEAWLLGDIEAVKTAYPLLADRIATKHVNYVQDDICGTWEMLADILTKRGLSEFRKKYPSGMDIGRCKSEWAEKIGFYLNIRNNVSPSFNRFLAALDMRLHRPEVVSQM